MVEAVEERSIDRGFHAISNRITTMRMCMFQKARPPPLLELSIYHNILTFVRREK